MSFADVAATALRFEGQGTYKLGGGAPFAEASPFADKGNQFEGTCDCSGFLAYCARYKRGPWNTDAIVADAWKRDRVTGKILGPGPRTRFRPLGADEPLLPGMFLVYPGPDEDHDGRRDHPGHCGIVTRILPGFVRRGPAWWEDLDVTHCSSSGQRKINPRTGKLRGAIRTTDASLWWDKGYLIVPMHLTA